MSTADGVAAPSAMTSHDRCSGVCPGRRASHEPQATDLDRVAVVDAAMLEGVAPRAGATIVARRSARSSSAPDR